MQKRVLFFIAIVVLVFAILPVHAKYSGGTGEPNAPYLIATPNDLNSIGLDSNDWSKHFLLVNDINMADITGTQFNIIGIAYRTPFRGAFDGNGHSIYNFTCQAPSNDYIALFGYVRYADIKNLTLINPNINGDMCVGSLVGLSDSGKITNCNTERAYISGGTYVGGLVGVHGPGGTILNCYSTGTVDGNSGIGGLVGGTGGDGKISNCYATANVSGYKSAVGGLVGSAGLDGEISNCYATGTVDGNNYTGGLIGAMSDFHTSDCYATGNVNGNNTTGGLVGLVEKYSDTSSQLENCYSTGSVSGNNSTGGLVGHILDSYISDCYTSGVVISNEPNTGGFMGFDDGGSYTKCFWDSDVNPDVNGIGNNVDPNVTGKSTTEMQKESTFTNWDFIEIWDIGENQTYPFLRQYLAADINHDKKVNFEDVALLANKWLKDGTE